MTARIDIKKENQNLIGLAVKCRLITVDQEQEILSRLIEKYQENPDYPVTNIFTEEKILSLEEIDFLFTIKDHLRIKMLDKRFGEIGVNNRFVNSEAVEKALDIQNNYFQKTRESKKIGDILLENEEISLADKTAILLTQDRVQDHLLEQAMNDIATSEMEKMTIKMRFGAIAVKKGLISVDQLNQALNVQNQDERSGQKKRYLGEIFQDLFKIPRDEVLGILKIQRELETKRLSLEKAISQYTSEVKTNKRLNELFRLNVSENKMEAVLHRTKVSFEKIDLTLFHNWLKLNGIQFGLCDDKLIEGFLNDSEPGASLTLARGILPSPSRDEVVEFFFDTGDESIPTVKKGEVLARITPHEFGKPGKDVLGHPIVPVEPKFLSLGCGEGVVRKDLEFLADKDGRPTLFKNRSLFVTSVGQTRPVRTVSGHITSDTKDTYDNANLNVEGNIENTGTITCHDLFVSGNVLGKVTTTGHVEVKGCIGMESKGRGASGYRTQVQSGGNVLVSKHITNAKIATAKGVTAPKSDLTSCEVFALQDIVIKNVYSHPGNPSVLQIGVIPDIRNEALENRIDEQKALLKKLQCEEELDGLKAKLQEKIQIQDEYLNQQEAINHLLKLWDDQGPEQVEEKIKALALQAQTKTEDKVSFPTHDDLEYMKMILNRIRDLGPEDSKAYLAGELKDISKMYRAAIHSTERFSSEHRARSKFLLRKIKKKQPEIDEARKKLEALLIRKDYFSLNERKKAPFIEPVIKVKNMVEKNTVIKGKKASMIIRQSIFGVKLREIKDPSTDEYEITIEGYYD
ncbi:flagellar assembly protein A [Desulfospira joergensenii]|uniref:flagellar assembly protein A n=1 Tax=Desulfospira joergensenii TaxID=53329 RepID=UPI0003B60D37|nr:flagellar assembly protein A [Desulfospira joergensenii]